MKINKQFEEWLRKDTSTIEIQRSNERFYECRLKDLFSKLPFSM
jgi:hypothetical protein